MTRTQKTSSSKTSTASNYISSQKETQVRIDFMSNFVIVRRLKIYQEFKGVQQERVVYGDYTSAEYRGFSYRCIFFYSEMVVYT